MHWAQFLHLYQPYYQQPDVLERIVGQSYRPIIEGLYERPKTRITLNASAVLLELFDKYDYGDLNDKLAEMGGRGQIEFVGSAKYHTLLPFLPKTEVLRQIQLNSEVSKRYLGKGFKPRGIFLPEMAYAPHMNAILEEAGFEYVLLDELAYNGKAEAVDYSKLYKIKGSGLRAFFRQRRVSNTIMHGAARDVAALKMAAGDDLADGKYLVTGMDGEVFGWHHPGHDQLLFEMLEDKDLGMVQVADLLELVKDKAVCEPVACSWADSQRDLEAGEAFYSWRDPKNPIQKLEWELQALTIEEFGKLPESDGAYPKLREKLDPALASDLFFWSSARPWWSIELIEEGAFGLAEVVEKSPASGQKAKRQAHELYRRIMDLAFEWRRNGTIAKIGQEQYELLRIPFKERTNEAVFGAFMDLMKQAEKAAAGKQDYETAALWRDAAKKLETKRDIYDAYHVVDMLRAKLPDSKIEETLAQYREQYQHIRGGQPEQRSN
jgi:hypothetical protein